MTQDRGPTVGSGDVTVVRILDGTLRGINLAAV